jgi:hypothetical protein
MKWGRLVVLLGAMTLWPSGAYAASGFWAWLEELSGPGPFHGFVLAAPVFCMNGDERVSCWKGLDHPPNRLLFVSVGRLGSGDNLRFKDLPDTPENRLEVNVLQISGVYMFRVHTAVDVGLGVGAMWVSGKDLDTQGRLTLIPVSAAVRPFAFKWPKSPWAHIMRAEVETSWVTRGFNAKQFGVPASSFSTGPEFLTRAAVVIDFSALWQNWPK